MDFNEIRQTIRDDFELDRIAKEEARQAAQAPVPTPAPEPVDYLRQRNNQIYEYRKRTRLNGSTQKIMVDARTIGALLRPHYQKAKDDSERMAKIGDKEGARIEREQYMRDVFLPAVEALVRENSPEEVMNATKALSMLDKYVLAESGRGTGYTGSFVASLYQSDIGSVLPTSDADVQAGVQGLIRLVQNDQIRSAVGRAKKIKASIDSGEHTASEEDYEIIQKIALRGQ